MSREDCCKGCQGRLLTTVRRFGKLGRRLAAEKGAAAGWGDADGELGAGMKVRAPVAAWGCAGGAAGMRPRRTVPAGSLP